MSGEKKTFPKKQNRTSPPKEQKADSQTDLHEEYGRIKSAEQEVVFLKPNFDDLHFFGHAARRNDYPPAHEPRTKHYEGPSWAAQYQERVKQMAAVVPPRRYEPGAPRAHGVVDSDLREQSSLRPAPHPHHEQSQSHGRWPPAQTSYDSHRNTVPAARPQRDISYERRGLTQKHLDSIESTLPEWEKFKRAKGDDPHKFIETLSDDEEKETWHQIFSLIGDQSPSKPMETVSRKRPLISHAPQPKQEEVPSFFRTEMPSTKSYFGIPRSQSPEQRSYPESSRRDRDSPERSRSPHYQDADRYPRTSGRRTLLGSEHTPRGYTKHEHGENPTHSRYDNRPPRPSSRDAVYSPDSSYESREYSTRRGLLPEPRGYHNNTPPSSQAYYTRPASPPRQAGLLPSPAAPPAPPYPSASQVYNGYASTPETGSRSGGYSNPSRISAPSSSSGYRFFDR
ncbi:unnamed protein product, partial [Mesorhabditis spiculigera]